MIKYYLTPNLMTKTTFCLFRNLPSKLISTNMIVSHDHIKAKKPGALRLNTKSYTNSLV